MNNALSYIKQYWNQSKIYRYTLIAALVYVALRMLIQLALLVGMFGYSYYDATIPPVPFDLQIYLDAAKHLSLRQDLYLKGSLDYLESHFPYAPAYAVAFLPFYWMYKISPLAVSTLHTLLHVVAYGVMYVWWVKIFEYLNLKQANEMLAKTLPVWLLFSSFWTDLGYLNIYIIMAMLATLFIYALLKQQLGWSVFWLAIILQIKPHWAFAAAMPLLLGQYRFFFKLLAWSIVCYVAILGGTILLIGPAYGWQQHIDYVGFLARLSRDFPWRTPGDPFMGYNHSVRQILYFWFDVNATTKQIGTFIKAMLLAPIAIVGLRYLFQPPREITYRKGHLALDLVFALYLGAFIWLDMVWELSLSIVIYPYLLSVFQSRSMRITLSAIYLPYALLDVWRIVSVVLFGSSIIVRGPYLLTDYNIYFPFIMLGGVAFYACLIFRLWRAASAQKASVITSEQVYSG